MKYLKVNGHDDLVRDVETGAIVNVNVREYENYIKIKEIKQREEKRVSNLEDEMSNIKNDLNEIKNLLRGLSNESR